MHEKNVLLASPPDKIALTVLRGDVPVDALIPDMVELLGLTAAGSEASLRGYEVRAGTHQRVLHPDATLDESGVRDCGLLLLRPISPGSDSQQSASRRPGEISVTVVDGGNRTEWTMVLPDDVTVARVMDIILERMNRTGDRPSARLIHGASRTELNHSITLREAGVRDGHVLFLSVPPPEHVVALTGSSYVFGRSDGRPRTAGHVRGTGATPRGSYDDNGPIPQTAVDCTLFAPPEATAGDALMLQVFVHTPDIADLMQEMSLEFDAQAQRRGVVSLGTRVAIGSRLTFELRMREMVVPEQNKEIVWIGQEWAGVHFEIMAPREVRLGSHIGTVLIAQDAVPVGEIKFKLSVLAAPVTKQEPGPVGGARRYQTAFISYASKDRDEVLRCVRLLPAAGIRFFQDVLELGPGDRWEKELWRHIDESDVMFLFWSTAAKESEWVQREWRYALEHKGEDHIRPVIIEGPPPVPPPDELQHLHFDDRVGYFLRAIDT